MFVQVSKRGPNTFPNLHTLSTIAYVLYGSLVPVDFNNTIQGLCQGTWKNVQLLIAVVQLT